MYFSVVSAYIVNIRLFSEIWDLFGVPIQTIDIASPTVDGQQMCRLCRYHHSMRMFRRMKSKLIRTIPTQIVQRISPLSGTYQGVVHFLWFMGVSWVSGIRCLVICTKEKFLQNTCLHFTNTFCNTNSYIGFNDSSKFWFTNQMSGFQVLDVFNGGNHRPG